jgi:hypothetical protein
VVEVKEYESDVGFDSEKETKKGIWIIDTEPNSIFATTKIHPSEPDEPEEGGHLFHSQMWVKGTSLYFIIGRGT